MYFQMYRSLQSPHGRGLGVATEGEADQEDRRSFDQADRTRQGRQDTCSRVLSVLLAKGNTEFPATLAQTLLESSKQQCAEGLNVAPDSDSRVWHDCI